MPTSLVFSTRSSPGVAQRVMVRRAVMAAEHPGGAVPHAVAGGIGAAGAVAFDQQRELAAQPAAVLAVAGRAGEEFMRLEQQREAGLGHLDAAEFHAPGGVPLAAGGPAIARREPPPPGRAWNMCQMKRRPVRGILAGDRHPEAPAPAAHGAVRAGRLQGADDRLDDLVGAMAGAHGHRRALPRPDHGALAGDHLQRAEGAVILRARPGRAGRQTPSRRRCACWGSRN